MTGALAITAAVGLWFWAVLDVAGGREGGIEHRCAWLCLALLGGPAGAVAWVFHRRTIVGLTPIDPIVD